MKLDAIVLDNNMTFVNYFKFYFEFPSIDAVKVYLNK